MAAREQRKAPDKLDVKIGHQRVFVNRLDVAHGIVGTAGKGGAVNHDVEAAQLGHGGANNGIHLVRVRGVHLHGDDRAAGGVGDFLGRSLQLVHRPGGDYHVAALLGQHPGDCLTDTAAPAGDKGLLALKSKVHFSLLMVGRWYGFGALSSFWILHNGRNGGNISPYRSLGTTWCGPGLTAAIPSSTHP